MVVGKDDVFVRGCIQEIIRQYLIKADHPQTSAHLLLSNGYTGAYLGMYASSNGQPTGQHADFDWVHYKGYSN